MLTNSHEQGKKEVNMLVFNSWQVARVGQSETSFAEV